MAQTGRKTLWIDNFHYQNADKLKAGMEVELEFEPNNPHDPNAIAVFARLGFIFKRKTQVGYIPKETAERMRGKLLPKATVVEVDVRDIYEDDEDDFEDEVAYTLWKFKINLL